MPNKIIILAGAQRVGKSLTLRALTNNRHVYEQNRKRAYVVFQSPQEKVGFCLVESVWNLIEHIIGECESKNCRLLILPFTLRTYRGQQLNSPCIETPVERMRAAGAQVHLVYLRRDLPLYKEPDGALGQMDDLMDRLGAERIASVQNDHARQAEELRRVITRIDP